VLVPAPDVNGCSPCTWSISPINAPRP
jgi:hypothetical protein